MRTPSLSAQVSNTAHLAHHDLLQAGVAVEAQVPHTSSITYNTLSSQCAHPDVRTCTLDSTGWPVCNDLQLGSVNQVF